MIFTNILSDNISKFVSVHLLNVILGYFSHSINHFDKNHELNKTIHFRDIIALGIATLGVFFVAQPSVIFGSDSVTNQTPILYVAIAVALGW